MATIDEIEELRAELAHCHLTGQERRGAEARLAELLRIRNAGHRDGSSTCGPFSQTGAVQ
jgi:hypothetical protein